MTIPELRLQIKRSVNSIQSREVYTVLLIILVGFASFGLGRLSRLEEVKVPIRIEQQVAAVASPPLFFKEGISGGGSFVKDEGFPPEADPPRAEKFQDFPSPGGQLVASKGGTKYHFPWCSGAQRISEANKIWFNSIEEARKAGYTPASNCKGLK